MSEGSIGMNEKNVNKEEEKPKYIRKKWGEEELMELVTAMKELQYCLRDIPGASEAIRSYTNKLLHLIIKLDTPIPRRISEFLNFEEGV